MLDTMCFIQCDIEAFVLGLYPGWLMAQSTFEHQKWTHSDHQDDITSLVTFSREYLKTFTCDWLGGGSTICTIRSGI